MFCGICYPAGEAQVCLQLGIGKSCLLVCLLGLYLILPVKLVSVKHTQGSMLVMLLILLFILQCRLLE